MFSTMNATRLSIAAFIFAGCAGNIAPPPADGGGGSGPPRPAICTTLETYTPTTTTPLSFATDIQPVITNALTCGLATACHGYPPVFLDPGNTKTMVIVGDPATAKAALLGTSVNAPTMANVVPGQVGQSFVAYKLHGADGLSCVASKCVAGASIGTAMPCGDPMPSTGGTITDANRTKILDWIAQGAAN
jgi:hypothetical protein